MDKSNEANGRNEAHEAIIELGVASTETQGVPTGIDEPLGRFPTGGISEG